MNRIKDEGSPGVSPFKPLQVTHLLSSLRHQLRHPCILVQWTYDEFRLVRIGFNRPASEVVTPQLCFQPGIVLQLSKALYSNSNAPDGPPRLSISPLGRFS